MSPLAWMIAGSGAAWLGATAAASAAGRSFHPELLLGMLGPLVSASATWVVVSRTFAAAPARLTGVMIAGFAVKMLLFAAYVAAALGPLGLRPAPFMVSFTAFFIALHLMEAQVLRRLFAGAGAPGGEGQGMGA